MGKFVRRFVTKKRGMEALQTILILAVAAVLLSLLKDKGKQMVGDGSDKGTELIKSN